MGKKKIKSEDDRLKIEVTFKKTEFERDLYSRIDMSSIMIGKAVWMKIAALEKLERDENQSFYRQSDEYKNNQYIQQEHKDDIPLAEEGLNNLLSMFS
jgi:hypothetical protein